MKLDNRNNTLTIKEAMKSIVYQLRICKQKTTNATPFQAHFARKPKKPLSNISTIPKSSNLSYENILHHYLDADPVPVEDYRDDNGWVTSDRSDILVEEAMQKAQIAGRRYNGDKNKSISRSAGTMDKNKSGGTMGTGGTMQTGGTMGTKINPSQDLLCTPS